MGKRKYSRTLYKDVKENQVEKETIELLILNKIPTWKNAVLHGLFRAFDEKPGNERPVKTGTSGLADRSALLPNGKTLYWEAKRTIGGVQSKDQIEFEALCNEFNAPYLIVSHWMDMAEYLDALGYLIIKL